MQVGDALIGLSLIQNCLTRLHSLPPRTLEPVPFGQPHDGLVIFADPTSLQTVERAVHRTPTAIEHVRVDMVVLTSLWPSSSCTVRMS